MPDIRKQKKKVVKRKRTGILGRISSINLTDSNLNINVYGKSGSGKTTFWSTFPGKILVLLTSDDMGELRSISKKDSSKIEAICLEESSDIYEIVEHINKTKEYKTLVLDHVTDLQFMVLKEVLGKEDLPAQMSWGVASQQQYGQCTLKTKELVKTLLKANCNTVLVAQEREFNLEESNGILTPYVSASLTPSAVGYLNSKCDYIVNTFIRKKVERKTVKIGKKSKVVEKETDEIEYCLRTGPDPVFITKFRVPKDYPKPDTISDPNYAKIIKIINGK